MHRLSASFLLFTLLTIGCSQPAAGPSDAARRYLMALSIGDADAAWSLLSDSARRETDRQAFGHHVRSMSEADRKRLSERAQSIAEGRLVARWESGTDALELEHRDRDAWLVVSRLPRFDRRDTPRAALETFASAIRAHDWATILAMAPQDEREGLTEAVLQARLATGELREELDAALSALLQSGPGRGEADQWTFQAAQHRADLRRMGGLWFVSDIR